MSAGPPVEGAPVYTHIATAGKVQRWVNFKDHWSVDIDFLHHLHQDLDEKSLSFLPAPRNPVVEKTRLADYDRPQPLLSDDNKSKLFEAANWAADHFFVASSSTLRSFEEAREYILRSDCAKSSPGYPWNLKFKSKSDVLNDAASCLEIKTWVETLEASPVACLFALSLKDEILKRQKVLDNQTRLFMSAPIEHHVACVMYFSAFSDKLMAERGTWSTAGTDFHYGGWNEMIRSFVHEWHVGLDASMYDMSIFRMLWACFARIMRVLNPSVPLKVMDMLFSMALDCFIIDSRGNVYLKRTGNPSGWFLTLILNTIINYVLCAYAYLKAFPDADRDEFERYVMGKLCGDDSWLNISKWVYAKYSARHIVECWRELCITVKEPLHESLDPAEIEYCGATSMLYEGIYIRKPRIAKFLDCLKFTVDNDPLYRLVRACSIANELWPFAERAIVVGYTDVLVSKYPYLAPIRSKVLLSERTLRNLVTGLE